MSLSKVLDNLSLIIPVCLIIVVIIFFHFAGSTNPSEVVRNLWKLLYYNIVWFVMWGIFVIKMILWSKLSLKERGGLRGLLLFQRYWIVGFILALFSFSVGGIIVDLSFLVRYLITHNYPPFLAFPPQS